MGTIGGYKTATFFLPGARHIDIWISLKGVIKFGQGGKSVPSTGLIRHNHVIVEAIPNHVARTGRGKENSFGVGGWFKNIKIARLQIKSLSFNCIHQTDDLS